LSHEMSSVVT